MFEVYPIVQQSYVLDPANCIQIKINFIGGLF